MDTTFIQNCLSPGETLLWNGVATRKFRLERKHAPLLFIVPFFLFFVSIPIIGIFESGSSGQSRKAQDQAQVRTTDNPANSASQKPASIITRILSAAFFLLIVGGFFAFMAVQMGVNFGNTLRRNVQYGVTNQRVIVVTGKKQNTIFSYHIGSLTDIRMKEWPDGLGKIYFGPETSWPYGTSMRDSNACIENIPEPRKVFQIISQARDSRSS